MFGLDMDRRLTPFSGRAALTTLRGLVQADHFTQGEAAAVALPLVDLLSRPAGARDRQLALGAALTVVDRQDGWAFVQATRDGYCGWLPEAALGPAITPTHRVTAPASHAYAAARVQAPDLCALPMGALLHVTATEGAFAATQAGFVPLAHLRRLDDRPDHHPDDPATVALKFLGTPYLWGGNSRAGLDCSGLVQMAFHACGRDCPGDSDLQQSVGTPLTADMPLQRNDLVFWKGHVALMLDATRLIHANGHGMTTAIEDLDTVTARIAASGGGPVTARRRPDFPVA